MLNVLANTIQGPMQNSETTLEYLRAITTYLTVIITSLGTVVTIAHAIKMAGADDEFDIKKIKKDIKKLLIIIAVGISLTGLTLFIDSFY